MKIKELFNLDTKLGCFSTGISILLVIVGFVFLNQYLVNYIKFGSISISSGGSGGSSVPKTEISRPENEKERKELEFKLDSFKQTKVLKDIQPEINEVKVSGIIWDSMSPAEKLSFAKITAIYCKLFKNSGKAWVVIKDSGNGKMLGMYNEGSGLQFNQ